MATRSWGAPALDFFHDGVHNDACYWLNLPLDASLDHWEQGRFCAPSYVDMGPNPNSVPAPATPAILSYTPGRGTIQGIRGNAAYTGPKQGQVRAGAIWPETGDVTFVFELEHKSLSWSAVPNYTYAITAGALVDASANAPFRFTAVFDSSARFAVSLSGMSPTTGAAVNIAAYWNYGATQGGITMPPAPAANTPIKIIATYNGAGDKKLRIYVEDPTGPLGGYRKGQTDSAAMPFANDFDDISKGESFIEVCYFTNYVTGSGGQSDIIVRDFAILPGLRPPGTTWPVPDSHTLTIDTTTNVGAMDTHAISTFQRGWFSTSKPSANSGVPVLGYGGNTPFALPTPIDNSGVSQTIGKWNGTMMSLSPDAVCTELSWSSGKTMTNALPGGGGTRAGKTFYFDKSPLDLQLQQLAATGVKRINYNHNHVSELIFGTSDFRNGALNRLTDNCGSHTHTSYHPHTGGEAMDQLDADICVSLVHYMESWVGPNGETFIVDQVKVGTEADTYAQWAALNGAVDQAYRYRYIRQALADYVSQTGRATGFDIVGIGFAQFKSTSSDAYTIYRDFLTQCAAWSLPVDFFDPHFLRGVNGFIYADRLSGVAAAAAGLVPAVQASAPKIVSNEQNGVGENYKPGALSNQYLGFGSPTDTTGDKRRGFGNGHWSGIEMSLLSRHMARTQYARIKNITLVNSGRTGADFDNYTTTIWAHWLRAVTDGRELPSGQIVRMLAECCGTVHAVPACTDPTTKAFAGTRTTDSKTWALIAKTAWAGVPTSSEIGGNGAQEQIQVRIATKPSREWFLFRCDRTHANYMTLIGWPNQGSLSLQRIQPETVTSNAQGEINITGLDHAGYYLLLEKVSAPALVAGTIVAGTIGSTTAAINSSSGASGGSSPLSYSWYLKKSTDISYSQVGGLATASVNLSALDPSTTYNVYRRVTDNLGVTADTGVVTFVTAAAGSSSVTSVTPVPTTLSLQVGQSSQLSATVAGTGSFSTEVSWSVDEPSGGSVTASTGIYTAPSAPGVYHVRATSTQDISKSGVCTVTVTYAPLSPGAITVSSLTSNSVSLGEVAPASGGSGLGTYTWLRSQILGDPGALLPGQTGNTCEDGTVLPGQTYYYTRRYTDGENVAETAQVGATIPGGGSNGGGGGGGGLVIDPGPASAVAIRPGGSWQKLLLIRSPSEIGLVNPQDISATIYRNGVAQATGVTFTELATGRQHVMAVIPGGWAEGDVIEVLVEAVVEGDTYNQIVATFVLSGNTVIPGQVQLYLATPLGVPSGPDFSYVSGATGPALEDVLRNSAGAIDLSGVTTVVLKLETGGGQVYLTKAVSIQSVLEGRVRVVWSAGDLDVVGTYRMRWYCTLAAGGTMIVDGRLLAITP